MKKLLLLLTIFGLISCAGPKGDTGATGATNIGHDMIVDFLMNANDLELLKKYVSTGTGDIELNAWADSLYNAANENLLIYKDTDSGKYYLVDTSSFNVNDASWNGMGSYVNNNQTEIFLVGNMNGGYLGLSYPYYKSADGLTVYYEDNTETPKDLESISAQAEATEVEAVKENLVNYGLSVERSEELSSLLNSYRKIKNKRGLNESEKDFFTEEVLGLNFKNATETLAEEGLDSLVDQAADFNQADPEAVRELINEMM